MNRILKYAWYQLIVIIVATLFAIVSLAVIAVYWRGKEFSVLIPLAMFIFLGLYKTFFPLKSGEIAWDERDKTIMRQATRISLWVTWYLFAAGGLIPILIIGNGSVHVMYYGWLVAFVAILFRVIWSISAIVQYRRGSISTHNGQVEGGVA